MDSHAATIIHPSCFPEPAYACPAAIAPAGRRLLRAVTRTVGILFLVPVVIVTLGVAGLVAGVVLELFGRL